MSLRLFFVFFVFLFNNSQTRAQEVPPGAVYKCRLMVQIEQRVTEPSRLKSVQYYDSSARLLQELHAGHDHPESWKENGHTDTLYADPSQQPRKTFQPWDSYVYEGKNLVTSSKHLREGFVLHTLFSYTADGHLASETEQQLANNSVTYQSAKFYTYDQQGRKSRMVIIANASDTEVINNVYYNTLPASVKLTSAANQIDQFITLDTSGNPITELMFFRGFAGAQKVSTYNHQSQLTSEIVTNGSDTISSNSFTYDADGQLARKEHMEEKNIRRVFVYKNRLPQLEEYWMNGKLWSTVRYEYEPVEVKSNN